MAANLGTLAYRAKFAREAVFALPATATPGERAHVLLAAQFAQQAYAAAAARFLLAASRVQQDLPS
jgi:hypothetical protein